MFLLRQIVLFIVTSCMRQNRSLENKTARSSNEELKSLNLPLMGGANQFLCCLKVFI